MFIDPFIEQIHSPSTLVQALCEKLGNQQESSNSRLQGPTVRGWKPGSVMAATPRTAIKPDYLKANPGSPTAWLCGLAHGTAANAEMSWCCPFHRMVVASQPDLIDSAVLVCMGTGYPLGTVSGLRRTWTSVIS